MEGRPEGEGVPEAGVEGGLELVGCGGEGDAAAALGWCWAGLCLCLGGHFGWRVVVCHEIEGRCGRFRSRWIVCRISLTSLVVCDVRLTFNVDNDVCRSRIISVDLGEMRFVPVGGEVNAL